MIPILKTSDVDEVARKYRENAISVDEYREGIHDYAIDRLESEEHISILRYLGDGSYGFVYSAVSPRYQSEVAVKITSSDDTRIEELDLWPTFHHPNVLSLLDVIHFSHIDVFVTPLLKTDLDLICKESVVLENPNGLDLMKGWLWEVLNGLQYLHDRKICHLDIKADNVLIDFDMKAVLGDFSFMSKSESLVNDYGVWPPYHPPEACPSLGVDVPVIGEKFDIWCFGIMAMNVLTGHEILAKVKENFSSWQAKIFPLLCREFSVIRFKSLLRAAFPASDISIKDAAMALKFLECILKLNANERPLPIMIMRDPFLGGADAESSESRRSDEGLLAHLFV